MGKGKACTEFLTSFTSHKYKHIILNTLRMATLASHHPIHPKTPYHNLAFTIKAGYRDNIKRTQILHLVCNPHSNVKWVQRYSNSHNHGNSEPYAKGTVTLDADGKVDWNDLLKVVDQMIEDAKKRD